MPVQCIGRAGLRTVQVEQHKGAMVGYYHPPLRVQLLQAPAGPATQVGQVKTGSPKGTTGPSPLEASPCGDATPRRVHPKGMSRHSGAGMRGRQAQQVPLLTGTEMWCLHASGGTPPHPHRELLHTELA